MTTSKNSTLSTFTFATDGEIGEVKAVSLQAAYAAMRAKITPAMVEDGATLWVEDEDGDRLTMGYDAD